MNIPQMSPFIGMEEYESMRECFETNWLTEGPKAKQFVDKLCGIIGVEYGVLAPNGTLALYLGLKALGIGEGDEVIVPNFTFIASANAVLLAGATPVFVDVELESLQIDIKKCKDVLTKSTKALMPVHMYGASCNMTQVTDFAKKYNLKIIEDAAQAMGVTWKGKHCGSFGDAGCFSFFADKTIATIEGGFIGTNDKSVHENLLYLRNHGRIKSGTFIHPQVGYNFRMNDIQAAIGLTQLSKRELIYKKKQYIYDFYCQQLSGIKQIRILKSMDNSNLVPFRFAIMTEEKQEFLNDYLTKKGIESRTFFYPLNKQPCFSQLLNKQNLKDENFKNSVYAYDHGLCLPIYPSLIDRQIKYICDTIKKYYGL